MVFFFFLIHNIKQRTNSTTVYTTQHHPEMINRYLSFTQVIRDEPHLNWGRANMCRWWSYSYRSSVIGRQGKVKRYRGHGKRTVHLDLSGRHTCKALQGGKPGSDAQTDRDRKTTYDQTN